MGWELEDPSTAAEPGAGSAAPPSAERVAALEVAAHERLRSVFGFETLRPLQHEALCAALAARDALVVMPTGGGKSLCYQLPALVRPGLTVVVSPLISLMHDQVMGLAELGVPAAMLNSGQDGEERRRVWSELQAGRLRLLYVSPERVLQPGFLEDLRRFGLNGAAIDEAHCISHWGHDFRPEYRQLGELKEQAPWLPIQAFTATATPAVRADIVRQLGLVDALELVGDFDRPNLTYRVQPRRDLTQQLLAVIRRHPRDAGIVYCLRRTDVEDTARALAAEGVRCAAYHAGMSPEARKRAHDDFQNERVDVVVATVAFGMGIDRSDVRFVVHASLPKGVEQYAQETGRAGRDGLASECVLFFGGSDFHGWKQLVEKSAREAEESGVEGALAEAEHTVARLERMWHFATSARCRHRALVEHFGQTLTHEAGCGACDVCLGEIASVAESQVVAQKILSCVVRVGQRFGAAHVTEVLRGSDSARVRQYGHESLSTWGLLRQASQAEVRGWIDQLIGQGHLAVAPGEYPTLQLTRSGVEVMKSERPVTLYQSALPARKKGAPRHALAREEREELGADVDESLFEHLRSVRRRLASERGVPPYLVFNDKTLALFAAQKPATPEQFRAIKGVGDKKAADLGALFLAEIATHGARSGTSPEPGPTEP